MRIAQLSPLSERVPPQTYGGTELIVSLLTDGLVEKGHQVTLFASGDSLTKANLVCVTEKSLRTDTSIPLRRWQAYDILSLLQLEKRQNEFDLIHNHMGYQALPFLKTLKCPSITTNHNIVKDYCAPIYLAYREQPYVAISNSYRALNYPSQLNYIATVYNGIDINQYPFKNNKREYLLFVGRICKDKGTLPAIEIAQALGLPLKIAGKIDIADKPYFDEKIQPLLKDPKIEYMGEVGVKEKVKLYNGAIAMLYPITFEEPFGLVMVEALCTGTPVLAFNKGAVSEIVKDGEVGVVCNTSSELIKRFEEVFKISHEACRKRAVGLFSSERMVNDYEKVYQSLCK